MLAISTNILSFLYCFLNYNPRIFVTTKRLRAKEREKQILQSAITVFAQDTYHGATTKRIAEEAGITEALIYRYFGSKRALFTKAIYQTTQFLVEGLEKELLRNKDTPFRAITNCFNYYVDVLESHKEFTKMLFLVISELDEDDVRKAYLPQQNHALKVISNMLNYWDDQGFLNKSAGMSPKTGAWLYFGTYLILALVKHSHDDVPLDASFAIELSKPYFTPEVFEAHQMAFA